MQKIALPGLRPAAIRICYGWDKSCWKLATLIICVWFLSCAVSDLEMLFSEVDWVTICQGQGMS